VRIFASDGMLLAFARVKIFFLEWNRIEGPRTDGLGEVEVVDAKLGTYRIEVVDGQTLSKVYGGGRFRRGADNHTSRTAIRSSPARPRGGGPAGLSPLMEIILIALPIATAACALILWRARRRKSEEEYEEYYEYYEGEY